MSLTLKIVLTLVASVVAVSIAWTAGLRRAALNAIKNVGPTPEQVRKKTEAATDAASVEVEKEEKEVRNGTMAQKIDFARALRERGRLRK